MKSWKNGRKPAGFGRWSLGLLAMLAFMLAACSDGDEKTPDEADDDSSTKNEPVVLVAERVQGPDARNVYVSLQRDLPTDPVDRSTAREFGSVDIYVHDGQVFIFDREDITLTRYRATDSYTLEVDQLEDGSDARLSFQQIGLPGFGFSHVFISSTRAYLVDWGEYRVVIWNPKTMEIAGTIDLSLAVKEGFVLSDSYLVSPVLSNGKVFIGVYVWQDYANAKVHPGAGVIALDAESEADPVLLEDPRITGAAKLYATEAGRVLVIGDQYSGMYEHFATEPDAVPPAGVLAIDSSVDSLDELRFDEEYFVDLLQLTGSPAIYGTYPIDESNLLVQAWDPEAPMSAQTLDDYWAAGEYVYLQVDLKAETSTRVDSIPKALAGSVAEFRLNDELYVQTYAEAGEDGTNSDSIVHRVKPDGVSEQFRVPSGDLWALERVR